LTWLSKRSKSTQTTSSSNLKQIPIWLQLWMPNTQGSKALIMLMTWSISIVENNWAWFCKCMKTTWRSSIISSRLEMSRRLKSVRKFLRWGLAKWSKPETKLEIVWQSTRWLRLWVGLIRALLARFATLIETTCSCGIENSCSQTESLSSSADTLRSLAVTSSKATQIKRLLLKTRLWETPWLARLSLSTAESTRDTEAAFATAMTKLLLWNSQQSVRRSPLIRRSYRL